jgi:tetratricopeptide (TPR) repeat protein
MSINQQDQSESFNPKSFIGRTLIFNGAEYEVSAFLSMGMEKMVYELKNLETGIISHVLKVHREKMNEERALEIQTKYRDLREALGEVVLETHYIFIDGWLAEIQPHLSPPGSGVLLFNTHDSVFSSLSRDKEDVKRITELYLTGNYAEALAECEKKLEEFPLKPDYLAIKGGALLGLDRIEEAVSTLELCVEIEPNEARHFFNLAVAENKAGHPAFALALVYQATNLAKNVPELWSFLFDLEVSLGRLNAASHTFKRLRELSTSASFLSDLKTRLDALADEISRIEEDMKVAWSLYDKDDWDGALHIANSISEKVPYCIEAHFLSGVISINRKQWDKAIVSLGQANALDISKQEVVYYLGYAYFMNDDFETSAGFHLFWLRQYLDAVNHLLELVQRSDEESNDEIIVEREIDIELLRAKEQIRKQCSTIQKLYGSISTPKATLETRMQEIRQSVEQLTSTLSELGL